MEAQEGGKEADLGFLKEFFSDRNKFPPDEISQFDQDDGTCSNSVCRNDALLANPLLTCKKRRLLLSRGHD